MSSENKIPTSEKISYISFAFGTSIIGMLLSTFLPMFYTDEIGLAPGDVALLLLILKVFFAVIGPIFGNFIDRFHLPGGVYKPWLTYGIFLLPLSIILLFLNFQTSLQILYVYISYTIAGTLSSLIGLPHAALITTMTKRVDERPGVQSGTTFANIFGSVVIGVAGGFLISNIGFFKTALIITGAAFITMLPLQLKVKERTESYKKDHISLRALLPIIAKNKHLMAITLSYFFVMATSFATSIGVYFVRWNLGNLELMGLIMIFTFIPVAILPIVIPRIIKITGKRILYISGLLLAIAVSIIQYFIGYNNLILFLFINAIKVFGIFMPVVMIGMFLGDCVEYSAYKNKVRNGALIFSIGGLANTLGTALSGSLSMFLLGLYGYNGKAEVQSVFVLDGIWQLMSIIPVAGLIIALLIFIFNYKLDEKDVQSMVDSMGSVKEDPAV